MKTESTVISDWHDDSDSSQQQDDDSLYPYHLSPKEETHYNSGFMVA